MGKFGKKTAEISCFSLKSSGISNAVGQFAELYLGSLSLAQSSFAPENEEARPDNDRNAEPFVRTHEVAEYQIPVDRCGYDLEVLQRRQN